MNLHFVETMDEVLAIALETPVVGLAKNPFIPGGVEVTRYDEQVAN
jgi:hypothetical protein